MTEQEWPTSNSPHIQSLIAGEKYDCQLPALAETHFGQLSGFIYRLLGELDLAFLGEVLTIILRENINNASKAIAKRLYFRELNLDIANPSSYQSGLLQYSNDVLSDWEGFRLRHNRNEEKINFALLVTPESIQVRILANYDILPDEWGRINQRREAFEKQSDVLASFSHIQDSSEGGGLGIFLTMMLLQNAGIPSRNYNIESANGKTAITLVIPRSTTPVVTKHKFVETVLSTVDNLPSFEENIVYLINLCGRENVSINHIANEIQRDLGLVAEILRMVNSAGYINRFNNPTLLDAVKIIGLKIIRNLLMVTGARSVMNKHFNSRELSEIWQNSTRVSFYARKLSQSKTVADQAPVASLLHNIGKIVLLSLEPSMVRRLQKMVSVGRVRNTSVIEEITLGISHPEIGAKLADKWKFPEILTIAIRYQQKPLQAPKEYEELVQTVYLAIRLEEASRGLIDYYAIEPEILQRFGITSPETMQGKIKLFESDYSLSNENAN